MSTSAESHRPAVTFELQPILSDRFAFQWKHAAVCAWFALFFMYANYMPLFHSDIWSHVQFGQWVLDHRSLPTNYPSMPLADGMRLVTTAWLSQTLLAAAERWGGPEALSNVYAVVVAATYIVQSRVFFLMSGRLSVALAGMSLSFVIGYTRHAIIRPEIFGGLLFATLLWVLVQEEPWRSRTVRLAPRRDDGFPWSVWFGVPAMFVLWANLHGTFAVGLAVLGCHALGAVIESAWRTRTWQGVCGDRVVQRWALLTELALVATLVNPYGLDLLLETVRFGKNPNLRDVLEWYPLKLVDLEGIQFTLAILALIVLYRHSRQRVRAADVLMLLLFAWSVASTVRMIGWFAPVLAFVLLPHASEIWQRLEPHALALWQRLGTAQPTDDATPAAESEAATPAEPFELPKFTVTLVCLLIVWCAFALSPISKPVLGGQKRPAKQLYSRYTPLGITQHLREKPPTGLVFGPQWWGDWLAWDGPAGMRLFMTTMLHLAPQQVWRDYLTVARGQSGWEQILDRYDVRTLIVHKELQPQLVPQLRRQAAWRVIFEDEQGIVLERTPPKPKSEEKAEEREKDAKPDETKEEERKEPAEAGQ